MRKVDCLSPTTEIILKPVPLEYRASRRKLDKVEIRFTLFAIICICGTYTSNWHSPFLCHCPSRSIFIYMDEYYKCKFLQLKTVSEYDQEILESQTADKPMTPRRRQHNHH